MNAASRAEHGASVKGSAQSLSPFEVGAKRIRPVLKTGPIGEEEFEKSNSI
jgi:hypothetical protein